MAAWKPLLGVQPLELPDWSEKDVGDPEILNEIDELATIERLLKLSQKEVWFSTSFRILSPLFILQTSLSMW